MPDLSWSPLVPADIPQWLPLLDRIREADGDVEHLNADDLQDELAAPWRDPERDGWIVRDADGTAVAFGTVDLRPGDTTQLRVMAWGGVDPDRRGQGIGREVLRRQLARAGELVARRRTELAGDPPAVVRVSVSEHATRTPALLGRAGLRQVRVQCVMRRDLSEPLPDLRVPAGVTLRLFTPELDDAVRLAHNEAFATHWGFQPWDATTWQQWETGHRDFHPEWSVVALDRLGVAGYLLSAGYQADWVAQGITEGWTSKLGVRPDRRRQGLGAALLVRAMTAYRDAGLEAAGLDVDAENTTRAVHLYTALGYRLRHSASTWAMEL